jgi:hypothetical protein
MPPQGPPQMPPQQQYAPQQYAPQQPYMPQQAQPPKKSNVLMWVLIGVGGLVLMVVLAIGVGSFFIYRTVKNAGFDADLMRSNPGLAMAKMVTSLNPDTEIVSTNDRAGTVVVKEKSTGKVVTMKFDPDKKSMVIVGDDGNQVSINASGDEKNGTLNIQGPDGSIKFGAAAGNATPAWLPVYPGSAPQGTMSTQTSQGSQNTYAFKTPDAPPKVISFFQDQLKSSGFTVSIVSSGEQGGMIQATDASKNRSVLVTAGASSGEGTAGTLTVIEKQ